MSAEGARDEGDNPSEEAVDDEFRARLQRIADSDLPSAEDAQKILDNA